MGIRHRLASMYLPRTLEGRAWRRRRNRPCTTVLMYHEVLPDQIDLPSWLVVKQSRFEAQMRHLRDHYDVLPLADALTRLSASTADQDQGRPSAVITFDDGYAGNYRCAFPILRRLGLPFTVYVATGKVESGGRYWYDDVICALLNKDRRVQLDTSRGPIVYSGRRLSGDRRWIEINSLLSALKLLPREERIVLTERLGDPRAVPELRMMTPAELHSLSSDSLVTIGNHTHTHDLLDQMRNEAASVIIEQAQELLQSWTGTLPHHFSYPNGNYLSETAQLVRERGFLSAVTTQPRCWQAADPVHEIPRIGIGRFDNVHLFRAKAAGLLA